MDTAAKNFVENILKSDGVQVIAKNVSTEGVTVEAFKKVYDGLPRTSQLLLRTRISRQIIALRGDEAKQSSLECLEQLYNVVK